MADSAPPPILIAEDDPNDLFLVRRHLARAGVDRSLVTFADGEALIAYLESVFLREPESTGTKPTLLFLDIKMPRRDGFQALAWIRAQPALRDLKVVVLSGSDEPADVRRAQELGAHRFLTKYPPPHVLAELAKSA